jgi:hypothetical protein
MQLIFVTNINLSENKDEKYIYIIHFQWHPKIDEIVIYVTWNVVYKPLNTTQHLLNLICDYKS